MSILNSPNPDFINQVYANTKSDLIQITDDKLRNILKDFIARVKKINDWLVPFSICLTLLGTFLTADFSKDFLNLSKSIWEGLFILIFIISFVWLIISGFNAIKNTKSTDIECLINEIKNIN
jgi:hypothetical protein